MHAQHFMCSGPASHATALNRGVSMLSFSVLVVDAAYIQRIQGEACSLSLVCCDRPEQGTAWECAAARKIKTELFRQPLALEDTVPTCTNPSVTGKDSSTSGCRYSLQRRRDNYKIFSQLYLYLLSQGWIKMMTQPDPSSHQQDTS